ncbi:uncharacterized protein LOC133674601 [Populus nigra]|uniref:uncharacterized protein LOC133674601 n=1 Tax=Populus nigra TaxID=3691 RepID=UPI002B27A9B3|nr:uncharacterized protein LOC133674601 [Populus nigra]
MDDEKWGEEDIREFTKLVENSEKAWELASEKLEVINVGDEQDNKELKIGTLVTTEEKNRLVSLLHEYVDVFAWTYADMPGLDTDIVVHKIPLIEWSKPIKQKTRQNMPGHVTQVPKKDGKIRVCVDYRDLNKASPKDDFPLPHIDILVDNAARNATYSFMDGFSGYNQIRMPEEDKEKTTFVTPWGTFCYKVMPFGLKNAGATYQRAMITLFHDLMHQVEVYVDDMQNQRKRKIPAKVESCKMLIRGEDKKTIGLHLTYEPIFRLLKKKNPGVWDDDCQEAFDKIKRHLQNPPLLVPPTPGRPLIMYLRVTPARMGREEEAVSNLPCRRSFLRRRLNPRAASGCCAWSRRAATAPQSLRASSAVPGLFRDLFNKSSKHNEKSSNRRARHLSSRIARWQVFLVEYDIVFMTRKAVKGSIIVDHLADHAMDDYESLNFDLLDEDVIVVENESGESDQWTLYFDGAVNVSGNGAGAIVISLENKQYPVSTRLLFECTNNTAEYEACIIGLEAALELKAKKLEVFGDSLLIICQVKGEWQTKDKKLRLYQSYILKLADEFEEIKFTHISRDKNQFADALATLASMTQADAKSKIQPINIEVRSFQAHCYFIEESPDGKPWCLNENEIEQALKEVHEGICATHANGHTMAKQIQRAGYFWLTMERDCVDYVKKCHKCQIYGYKINAPPAPLFNMISPWPFDMWGLDVIGPINPKASNRHRFILVAIDYFTKWVEANSYAHVTQKVVKRFIEKDLIKHLNSSTYRPKMNGAVEAAYKTLKKIIQKIVITYKDWHEMLPYALHAYRTTVRTSTNATPYSLVYGMEAVMPLEIEIPSLRILKDAELDESEWARSRFEQLNLIDERRLAAICHHQLYQSRIAKAYNKKVKPRVFREGDLVLRKISLASGEDQSKWAPNYEGPYVVKKAFSGGALILTNMDGRDLPRPVNSDVVKKYYA